MPLRLAGRVRSLLTDAGIDCAEDRQRGFDHGVFVPLLIAYPDAQLPTLQLSLRRDLDPAAHLVLGRALAPLRDEGVLILGSGMSYHNMAVFRGGDDGGHSERFDAWLRETVEAPASERDRRLRAWTDAPSAREAHPREEHLLPLMVVAGAAGDAPGKREFADEVMGATISAYRFG